MSEKCLSAKDCCAGDAKVIGVQAIRLIASSSKRHQNFAEHRSFYPIVGPDRGTPRPSGRAYFAVVVRKATWQTNGKTRAWRSFGLR
jgi:hypothetical protein